MHYGKDRTRPIVQFSLRFVFLVILVLGAFFAGQGSMLPTMREKDRAIEEARRRATIAAKRYEQALRGELLSILLKEGNDPETRRREELKRIGDAKTKEERDKLLEDVISEWEELSIDPPVRLLH